MRVGRNPAKSIKHVPQPAKVTVAVVTYIPALAGYYAHSLDVLKVCLESIWDNTNIPYDLMVFDNASCQEVREYLVGARDAGNIQYLILSEGNIGKLEAWNFIFGAAPGEFIAYADSDIYHYPGWLATQVEVFDTFPKVGMVTGMPLWTPEEFSTSTIQWAQDNPDVRLMRGQLLSWEDYWRHARSLGTSMAEARSQYDENESVQIVYQGKEYYVGAGHFQFVAKRSVLQEALPIPSERLYGGDRFLDIKLNDEGYLRLSTPDWLIQHLGNALGEFDKIARDGKSFFKNTKTKKSSLAWFLKFKVFRMIAWKLYNWLFEVLHNAKR